MNFSYWLRQFTCGTISGLSLCVFCISCGALIATLQFPDTQAAVTASLQFPYTLGAAVAAMLVTGIVGSCHGLFSKDKLLVSGPDANSLSVLTGFFTVFLSIFQFSEFLEESIPILLFLSAIITAIISFICAYFKVYKFIRFLPFSVIAGFLASSGFLMLKGAAKIISFNLFSIEGFQEFISNPWQPELLVGFLIAGSVIYLSKYYSPGVLIPVIFIFFCIIINLVIRGGLCVSDLCTEDRWFFTSITDFTWKPSWEIDWRALKMDEVFQIIPFIFIVSLVAIFTTLFTLSSLEISNNKEYDLSVELKSHTILSVLSASFGGFIPVLAIGRITINKTMGGALPAGIISGGFALATISLGSDLLNYIPKACMGGLLIFIGINLLKGWTINQRSKVEPIEIFQIILILFIVAWYGFIVGVIAGVVMACLFFVYTYSNISVTYLHNDLKVLQSSVIRSDSEQKILENFGQRVKVFRLTGYLFFGSIYNLENKLSKLDINDCDCIIIDFTKVSGMDSSASQVFQRILTRYSQHHTQWFFVYTLNLQNKLLSIQKNQKIKTQMLLFKSFDLALEASEDLIIQKHQINQLNQTCFSFFSKPEEIEQFKAYCQLKTIQSDDFLVREGDRSNDLFFLKSGEFEVIKDINHQEIRLAKLKAGAMVGELAFYNHGERSASIRANCNSEVYVLTKDSFKAMRNHTSDLASQLDFYVIRKISQSLLKTNKLIDSIV